VLGFKGGTDGGFSDTLSGMLIVGFSVDPESSGFSAGFGFRLIVGFFVVVGSGSCN
jgi:hypothetical protein